MCELKGALNFGRPIVCGWHGCRHLGIYDVGRPVVNGRPALDALFYWVHAHHGASGARPAGAHVYLDGCGPPYWPPCNPTCPGAARR